MKLQLSSPRVFDPYNWHTWFAWHPVIVNNAGYVYLVWLEYIERKEIGYWGDSWYEYEFFKLP